MRGFKVIIDFMVFCVLAVVGVWMLVSDSYVMGALIVCTAIYQAYQGVRKLERGDYYE